MSWTHFILIYIKYLLRIPCIPTAKECIRNSGLNQPSLTCIKICNKLDCSLLHIRQNLLFPLTESEKLQLSIMLCILCVHISHPLRIDRARSTFFLMPIELEALFFGYELYGTLSRIASFAYFSAKFQITLSILKPYYHCLHRFYANNCHSADK